MIKINLLGEEHVVDQGSKLILVGYVASVAAALLLFMVLQASITSRVSDLGREVEDLNTQLASLKKVTQEVRDLEQKKAELGQITATIARLKLSQEGPVQVLDDLNKAVPAKAWIRGINEKDGIMTISGMALNDHEVVGLMKNLETSDYFESIDLVESVTANLLKITALNHFNNRYTRYVVRTEDKQATLKMIQDQAKKNGFKFENSDGPPVGNTSSGSVSVMSTGKLDADSKFKNIRSGVFKSSTGRVERVTAWSSVQPVPGKVFSIRAKVIYAGKLKALLSAERSGTSDAGAAGQAEDRLKNEPSAG